MTRGNNLSRVFSEIVSLDAWHSSFDSNTDCASVHVDLSFLEGKLGAEAESEVRFRLRLNRAELVFIIPPMEPLKVIQGSVDREATVEGVAKFIREHEKQVSEGLEAAAAISRKPKLSLSGNVTANQNNLETFKTEMTLPISNFRITQSKDGDGNYRWELKSETGGQLNGKVWDPVKHPRLRLKRTESGPISPTCRVMVRCRRQDFSIDEITLKSKPKLIQRMSNNRNVAASAFIAKKLEQLGFYHDNFDEDFSNICLAELTISEETQ